MPTLEFVMSGNVPDGTYFRRGDCEPILQEGVLTVFDGEGTERSSWGAPKVTSTIILQTEDLVSVHTGFVHKHRGGQFWRHYTLRDGNWQQIRWQQLEDTSRDRILVAYEDRAPKWANRPGKLRANYTRTSTKIQITYKLVEVIDGAYYSVFIHKTKPRTNYALGIRLMERAVQEHQGGYFSYPDREEMMRRFAKKDLFPAKYFQKSMTLALIQCEISGTIISYEDDGGYRHLKLASTYLRPVAELERFEYIPENMKEAV